MELPSGHDLRNQLGEMKERFEGLLDEFLSWNFRSLNSLNKAICVNFLGILGGNHRSLRLDGANNVFQTRFWLGCVTAKMTPWRASEGNALKRPTGGVIEFCKSHFMLLLNVLWHDFTPQPLQNQTKTPGPGCCIAHASSTGPGSREGVEEGSGWRRFLSHGSNLLRLPLRVSLVGWQHCDFGLMSDCVKLQLPALLFVFLHLGEGYAVPMLCS